MTEMKHVSGAIFTQDTPYLALTGLLMGVFVNICEKTDSDITAPHCISSPYRAADKQECVSQREINVGMHYICSGQRRLAHPQQKFAATNQK